MCVFLVAFVVWLSMNLFFKINRIEVTGSTIYGEGAIISASGVSVGDSPFFIDKNEILLNIFNNFPYVAEASLIHRLPGTLVIEITERQAMGMVVHGNSCWLIDGAGRLLEQTSMRTPTGKPLIWGLDLQAPAAGNDAAVPEEDRDRLTALLILFRELTWYELLPDTTEIDVSQAHLLRITYDNERFQVLLGDVSDLDIKIPFMLAAVQELPAEARGTVDVSRAAEQKKASYIPDATPAP
ncbi:MAG: FtsQ-type POTRA domain-containing protein [Oscillospiraceae bacterium]|nr:FtsQ-type POTRA domain-containing protein [Oscillospiraceae bacterium]